ncbi:MAG: hypothetical protein JF587_09300 [Catenulisporales bacterium]|nr:hypothetical protein [Catenulisporales bacterium]
MTTAGSALPASAATTAWANRGQARAGFVLGVVTVAMWVLWLVLVR